METICSIHLTRQIREATLIKPRTKGMGCRWVMIVEDKLKKITLPLVVAPPCPAAPAANHVQAEGRDHDVSILPLEKHLSLLTSTTMSDESTPSNEIQINVKGPYFISLIYPHLTICYRSK